MEYVSLKIPVGKIAKNCRSVFYMALFFECRKNALLQTVFLAILPTGFRGGSVNTDLWNFVDNFSDC